MVPIYHSVQKSPSASDFCTFGHENEPIQPLFPYASAPPHKRRGLATRLVFLWCFSSSTSSSVRRNKGGRIEEFIKSNLLPGAYSSQSRVPSFDIAIACLGASRKLGLEEMRGGMGYRSYMLKYERKEGLRVQRASSVRVT